MTLHVENARGRYGRVPLVEPSRSGYLQLAVETRPATFPMRGHLDTRWLDGVRELVGHAMDAQGVQSVRVFEAVGRPPVDRLPYIRDHRESVRVAQFDAVILVETADVPAIATVGDSPWFQALHEWVGQDAVDVHTLRAQVVKQVGAAPETPRDLALFNFFVADDPGIGLALWDYLADWYRVEMGMDHAELLGPVDGTPSDYMMVNYATWDGSLARFLASQLTKRSFRDYVLKNLEEHHVGAMPTLYRPVVTVTRGTADVEEGM